VRQRTTAQAAAEGLRIFIAGVPWHIKEDTLKRDFEDCGVIEDFFMLKDNEGYSKGKAFVTYQEKSAVEAALKFDNTEYGGRKIFVKVAEEKTKVAPKFPPKETKAEDEAKAPPTGDKKENPTFFPVEKPEGCTSLCLKNLGSADVEDVRGFLKDVTIQSVRIVMDRMTGQSRGIAFVDFPDGEEVDKAFKYNGETLLDQTVEMRFEAPKARPRPDGCMAVAIKKIDSAASDDEVRKLFEGLDSITGLRIMRDKEQLCTGLAFAEFSKAPDVEAAVKRSGMAIRGKTVFICYETKAPKKKEDWIVEEKKKRVAEKEAGEKPAKKKKKKKEKAEVDAEEPATKTKKPKAVKPADEESVADLLKRAQAAAAEAATGDAIDEAAAAKKKKRKKEKEAAVAEDVAVAEEPEPDCSSRWNKKKKKAAL